MTEIEPQVPVRLDDDGVVGAAVFLVSRMHEKWTETRDNRRAVTAGVADTGGVIVTAAAIMACVFASFGIAGVRTISEFGVGLAVAVLADAFLLRMTVVPALMHLTGKWNWAIPSWLDRVLPHVSVASPGAGSPARPADEPLKLPVVSTVTDGPARIAERAELLEVLGSVPMGGDGETTARSGEEL